MGFTACGLEGFGLQRFIASRHLKSFGNKSAATSHMHVCKHACMHAGSRPVGGLVGR